MKNRRKRIQNRGATSQLKPYDLNAVGGLRKSNSVITVNMHRSGAYDLNYAGVKKLSVQK